MKYYKVHREAWLFTKQPPLLLCSHSFLTIILEMDTVNVSISRMGTTAADINNNISIDYKLMVNVIRYGRLYSARLGHLEHALFKLYKYSKGVKLAVE